MSTIKVTNIEHASTGNGGIQLDSAGHVTVDSVQMPTAGPLSNRNLIINGAMNIAQRGTSSTSGGIHTIDRFGMSWGGGAVTQTQESLTSGDPYNEGFRKFARLQNTTAATGSADYREILYKVEAQDLAQSGWQYTSASSYITLSFWARASVAQTYYVFLMSIDGDNQVYSFPITLTANTWTKITETISGDSDIVIDNDNGPGMYVSIVAFYGTAYTDSGNTDRTWRARSSGNDYTLDMTNTWANTTNATFDLTGIQLEVGEKATPFEHRSYGDELTRCERYFELMQATNNVVTGYAYAASSGAASLRYRTKKRAAPGTVTLAAAGQSSGQLSFLTSGGSYPSTTGTHTVDSIGVDGFRIDSNNYSSLTDDSVSVLYMSGAGTVAKVDAEL